MGKIIVACDLTHSVEALGHCISPQRHVLPVPPSGESIRAADLCLLTTFRISQHWRTRKTISVSRRWPRSPAKCNHLFTGSLQPSLKISRKSVRKFLRKVANRQTNNDENILAEVTNDQHENDSLSGTRLNYEFLP